MAKDVIDAKELAKGIDDVKKKILDIEDTFEKTIGNTAKRAHEKVSDKVENYPLSSLGVALGTGILIGKLGSLIMKAK